MEGRMIKKIEHETDRLSSLPDPILVDIFSRLPFESAVSTDVLSQRYRGLWTEINSLDLDFMKPYLVSSSEPTIVILERLSLCSVDLSRVKKLRISMFSCQWRLAKKVIKLCPMLEDFTLTSASNHAQCPSGIEIIATNLKRLSLNFLSGITRSVLVTAPALEQFSLYCPSSVRCSFSEHPRKLVEAEIKLSSYGNKLPLELLEEVSNVKSLEFEQSDIWGPNVILLFSAFTSGNDKKLPIFHNMTRLRFSVHSQSNYRSLIDLLSSSPALECLHLDFNYVLRENEAYWVPSNSAPVCLVNCIRRIDLDINMRHVMQPMGNLVNMLKYLLSNAKVLEHMILKLVNISTEAEIKQVQQSARSFCEQLAGYPRSSSKCFIEISGKYIRLWGTSRESNGLLSRLRELKDQH